MTRAAAAPAILVLLLAIPFDPFWIDFEAARRALLLVVVGLLCAVRGLPLPSGVAGATLFALAGWHVVRIAGATNVGDAQLDALHWCAVALAFAFASGERRDAWLDAALPAGAVVSIYVLAQASGFAWPFGYGGPKDPVATLGNRNVTSEFLAVAFAAAAIRARDGRWLDLGVAALTVAALVVVGSRSGFAIVLAAAWLCTTGTGATRAGRLRLLGTLGSGGGVGLLVVALTAAPPAPDPRDDDPNAPARSVAATPSTLAVRTEVWGATLRMVADHPFAGVGTGQYCTEFPRYRTEREIGLSSMDHRFATRVDTAHQDLLELLAETGPVGIGLLVAFLIVIARRARAVAPAAAATLAPVIVLVAIAFVRSPFANAPAVVLALAPVAAALGSTPHRATAITRTLGVVVAIVLIWPGVARLTAAWHGARYMEDRFATAVGIREKGFDRLGALDAAVRAWPADTVVRLLRATERFARRDADPRAMERVGDDLVRLSREDPYGIAARILRAEFEFAVHRVDDAERSLRSVLLHDPRNPKARTLLGTIRMLKGNAAGALTVLYDDPVEPLRERMADVLMQWSDGAKQNGRDDDAMIFAIEAAFWSTLQIVSARAGSPEATRALRDFAAALPPGHLDFRLHVMSAVHWLALGKPRMAEDEAHHAANLTPSSADRRSVDALLRRLDGIPAWRDLRR